MPKVKTNSAAKKRFSFTGTGKIKRRHAFHRSLMVLTQSRFAICCVSVNLIVEHF